ncbi:MAG TPA: cation diffusion facilitator family transporter, partial [Candidatus Wallbacteria bacterium]|nr:cation diffusion facilitator family transporter [Candidatus Wallbacteria bacterium]
MNNLENSNDIMNREKNQVALTSVIAAVFLTVMKLIVGYMTGSLGIISEALHSGLDFVAAFITWIAVKLSSKPPDKKFNYGRGKIESFSALIETLLLLVTCFWIIHEAVDRLKGEGGAVEVTVSAFVIMIISIIVDYSRSSALYKIAKKYNSQALMADALHFSSDILSSAVVIVGLIFVKIGYPYGD